MMSKRSRVTQLSPAEAGETQSRGAVHAHGIILEPGMELAAVEAAGDSSSTVIDVVPALDLAQNAATDTTLMATAAPHLKEETELAVTGGNRSRFMAGVQPAKVTCNISTLPLTPGIRWSFKAICIVVYPASTSPPERRYVLLADAHGTTGITVWNANVKALGPHAVGSCVSFTRLALAVHNGKKSLTMSKESSVHVDSVSQDGPEANWWRGLLSHRPLTALQFQDAMEDTIVNVAGILGLITVEEKTVRHDSKNLLVLRFTDRTGQFEVRSWNHSDAEFLKYKERPLMLQRVRVTMYAGQRVGELLDGDNGTIISTDFDRTDLEKYWSE